MTIATTNNRASFAGNGTTTAFSYPNKFLDGADLVVTLRVDATGVETVKTLTTHYTVSGAGAASGGTVTMITAPAVGETLVIYQDPSATQLLDLVENDAFPAENIEKVADRIVIMVQRLKDRANRSVHLSDGFSPTFNPALPSDLNTAALKCPMVSTAGTGFANAADWPSASAIAAASANATAAATSATSASGSASSASASAAAATATLASAFFRDVLTKAFADSPISVVQANNGVLFVLDSSAGAIVINLAQISTLTLPFNVAFLLKTAGNTVTINRGGADTINGGTSLTLSAAGTGYQLAAKGTDWATLPFGSVADESITPAKLAVSAQPVSSIINIGVSSSVGANALTVSLTNAAGSVPSTSSPVRIPFRSSTLASGAINVRSLTAALSLSLSSGSTLGHTNGRAHEIFIYAIDNGGALKLGLCGVRLDEGVLHTTVAEGGAGGADSNRTLYSDAAYANVPIRLVARSVSTQTTAGTWAAIPSAIAIVPFAGTTAYSEIVYGTPSGYGSGATAVRRFTVKDSETGSAFTGVTDATNGLQITINEAGIYAATYLYDFNTAASTGEMQICLDGVIQGRGDFAAANRGVSVTAAFYATPGQVITFRGASANSVDASSTKARVTKVA